MKASSRGSIDGAARQTANADSRVAEAHHILREVYWDSPQRDVTGDEFEAISDALFAMEASLGNTLDERHTYQGKAMSETPDTRTEADKLSDDVRFGGTAFMRIAPDGTVARLDPFDVVRPKSPNARQWSEGPRAERRPYPKDGDGPTIITVTTSRPEP